MHAFPGDNGRHNSIPIGQSTRFRTVLLETCRIVSASIGPVDVVLQSFKDSDFNEGRWDVPSFKSQTRNIAPLAQTNLTSKWPFYAVVEIRQQGHQTSHPQCQDMPSRNPEVVWHRGVLCFHLDWRS